MSVQEAHFRLCLDDDADLSRELRTLSCEPDLYSSPRFVHPAQPFQICYNLATDMPRLIQTEVPLDLRPFVQAGVIVLEEHLSNYRGLREDALNLGCSLYLVEPHTFMVQAVLFNLDRVPREYCGTDIKVVSHFPTTLSELRLRYFKQPSLEDLTSSQAVSYFVASLQAHGPDPRKITLSLDVTSPDHREMLQNVYVTPAGQEFVRVYRPAQVRHRILSGTLPQPLQAPALAALHAAWRNVVHENPSPNGKLSIHAAESARDQLLYEMVVRHVQDFIFDVALEPCAASPARTNEGRRGMESVDVASL